MTFNTCVICKKEYCDTDFEQTLKGEPICKLCYRNALAERKEKQELKEMDFDEMCNRAELDL